MLPDYPPPTSEELAELARLRAHATALVEEMDVLLAFGKAANAIADGLYEELGAKPGVGSRVLLGPNIPRGDQHVYSRLLTEYENIEETVLNFEERVNAPAARAAGPRAVGSRYRI